MGYTRRQALAATGTVLAVAGCLASVTEESSYEGTDRIYTCGYDARAYGLDDGEEVTMGWLDGRLVGQSRDIVPTPDGDILVTDDHGLWKLAQRQEQVESIWRYGGIDGSIRGITIDPKDNYYIGSWTAGQGFHKVAKTDEGQASGEWVYEWADDNGLITAAAAPDGRLALALKNGSVHLIEEEDGQPVRRWQWSPGTGAIVREVLWDGEGNLYVASEDHHLYKIRAVEGNRPEFLWQYDAGNILFGASVTPQGSVYVATNAGEIHALQERNGGPQQKWVYQHTDYEGAAPTDEYFWDGLAHQVAARPNPEDNRLYSCAYGENTVHRIDVIDGEPVKQWEFDGHTDNVREVRIHGESVSVAPELWEQFR